jgi:Na+/phosphate symporter
MKTTNRTLKDISNHSLSKLEGTLAITGFAAEVNLRDVAQALAEKDISILAKASDRNAKLARLRVEIDEQVAHESAKVTVGVRERKRLSLTSEIALMYEKFGAHTVPIAQLCAQVVLQTKPSRVTEIKKLIEHVVYIADKAVQAFIDEDLSWAQAAVEHSRAATELYHRIKADLASLAESSPDAEDRINLLIQITDETQQILKLVSEMARYIVSFIQTVEL